MIKHVIALIAFSVIVIFSASYAQQAMHALLNAHAWISEGLTTIFSGSQAGNLAKELLALLSLPILVSLVPALLYWILRRHWFPYFMEIVWIIWLVQAGALMVMSRTM